MTKPLVTYDQLVEVTLENYRKILRESAEAYAKLTPAQKKEADIIAACRAVGND